MRKRSTADVSSLDMLLDTVCNTFGGICFIALLVSILSANLPPDASANASAQFKVVEQDMRLENLTRERNALQAALEIQEKTLSRKATNEVAYVISEKLKAIVENKDEADALESVLRRKLEALLAENAQLTASAQMNQRELDRLKALNEELKAKRDKAKRDSVQVVRLPMEHSTSRAPYHVFIVKNRIYPLYEINFGSRSESEHCTFSTSSSEMTIVKPRPGAGFPIPLDPRKMPFLSEIIRLMKDDLFLNVYVDGDSFDSFCKIRNIVIAAGIPYNWDRFEDPMIFVPATSFSVQ